MVPGEVILLKYKILRILKNAKESCIFLVEHIDLNSYWIIKKVNISDATYIKEIELLKGLKHDNIPLLVDVIEQDPWIYIVREYIDGKTLDQYMEDLGQIDEQEGIRIGISLCKIVEFFHSFNNPIIIRDIKPNNIIIAKDGTIKLIDFSIAKKFSYDSVRDTEYLGTKGFAAIEQYGIHSKDKCDVQTDVFGIGATLYYLFSRQDLGRPPYRFQPLRQFRNDLSMQIERILLKACQLKKEDRYVDVSSLRAELQSLIKEERAITLMSQFENLNKSILFIQGIKEGVGTTHHSLGIARFLKKRGLSVLLIDHSQNQMLKNLEYQEGASQEQGILTYLGIPILFEPKNSQKDKLHSSFHERRNTRSVLIKSYEEQLIKQTDVIVIDGGCLKDRCSHLFQNQPIEYQHLMIAAMNPWEIEEIEEFILTASHESIDYGINFATQKQVDAFQSSIPDKKIIGLPISLFDEQEGDDSFYLNLLQPCVIAKIDSKVKEEKTWGFSKEIFSKVRKSKIPFRSNIK